MAGLLLVTVRKRATVIAVERRATNRTIYARVAASLGTAIEVQTVSAAHDALRWLKRRPADLVITDSWRLDLDKPGFLALLRKHPASRNTPVTVLTVGRDMGLRGKMLNASATMVVHTPIAAIGLRTMFHDLLRPRRWLRAGSARPAPSGIACSVIQPILHHVSVRILCNRHVNFQEAFRAVLFRGRAPAACCSGTSCPISSSL